MKKKITKEVWVCDVCEGESRFLNKCEICNNEHCSVCSYIGFNPLHLDICKAHQEDFEMKAMMDKFSKRYNKLKDDIINSLKKTNILNNLK